MDLFVYGTLQSRALMEAVAGDGILSSLPAVLPGYQVFPVANHVVPFIRQSTEGTAQGVLWQGVSQGQVARLDAYELAFDYRLVDIVVQQGECARPAKMYLPPNDIQQGQGDWSLSDWERDHLQAALFTCDEIFADGAPDPQWLRQSYPMIEKRAWAKVRAANRPQPAQHRHAPTSDDVVLQLRGAPQGEFFRIQAVDVRHRRFDGTMEQDLPREVFVGTEAALVLPYDPQLDRVLLVEQMRMGPAVAGDPNPWSLEPVAGMIDPRETPWETAVREATEESGLTFRALENMVSFYPSPGSSTDYFHCFLGVCDLPRDQTYTGGLDAEAEDLRLHTLSFDEAMRLIDTGEVTAGPLITMLFWLARERDRLRATA